MMTRRPLATALFLLVGMLGHSQASWANEFRVPKHSQRNWSGPHILSTKKRIDTRIRS
jgi:hypothetical protein